MTFVVVLAFVLGIAILIELGRIEQVLKAINERDHERHLVAIRGGEPLWRDGGLK